MIRMGCVRLMGYTIFFTNGFRLDRTWLKHWYHLTTKDFIHYEDHGVAMYPDTESDSYGCYTGMALKEGEKVHVFYTGIENEEMIPCTCYARFDGEKLTDGKRL